MALVGSVKALYSRQASTIGGAAMIQFFGIAVRLKSYKSQVDRTNFPNLHEEELEEQFVRGSGPGGQATNKTSNAVILKHRPSGLVVRCHETRSQELNRKRARQIMLTKLDNFINGDQSLQSQECRLREKDQAKAQAKKRKLAELKKNYKEREGFSGFSGFSEPD